MIRKSIVATSFLLAGFQSHADIVSEPWSINQEQGTMRSLVGDFNGDGQEDIIGLRDRFSETRDAFDIVYFDHSQSFAQRTLREVNTYSSYIHWATSDFDKDGISDIVVNIDGQVQVWFFDQQGTIAETIELGSTGRGDSPFLADLNGDGQEDILIPTDPVPPSTSYEDLALYVTSASRNISQPTIISTNSESWLTDMTAGDFDGDGHTDLVVEQRGNSFRVYLNPNGNGQLEFDTQVNVPFNSIISWSAFDADNDGSDELLVGFSARIASYDRNENGQWTVDNRLVSAPAGMVFRGLTAQDVNQDGHNDLIYIADGGRYYGRTLNISEGPGFNSQLESHELAEDIVSTSDFQITVGNLDDDNCPDLLVDISRSLNYKSVYSSNACMPATDLALEGWLFDWLKPHVLKFRVINTGSGSWPPVIAENASVTIEFETSSAVSITTADTNCELMSPNQFKCHAPDLDEWSLQYFQLLIDGEAGLPVKARLSADANNPEQNDDNNTLEFDFIIK
ncbi:FG-GAP repeat domain-containing protein [Aliikangiella coralliicola]|uniref:VCBS repeat-containing protein n=1 Tax=Aliikangiella coralliicola TaxID=2592383 RepID=A0A545UC74_9GAMM|nr:VCBS repeat-containing protein [Aliikangiella coralliicola]TQV87068.1 VCBS repeat-containing protein [Aliikangiella coralliicola]